MKAAISVGEDLGVVEYDYPNFHLNMLWKRCIFRIWVIGFISDILGALLILAVALLVDKICPEWNTFYFPGATLIAVPGVLLSAVGIFLLTKYP